MALPTGRYRALLLYSQVIGAVEKFFFVLPETGERGEAIVMKKDIHERVHIAAAGKLSMVQRGQRLPPETPELPVVILSLRFVPKFDNNVLVAAHPTGERLPCDIRRKATPTFPHVEF